MSRRLSSIGYAHRFGGHPNPVDTPRVLAVWEGIRREKAQPVDRGPRPDAPGAAELVGAQQWMISPTAGDGDVG